jgi:hypothetical protein
MGRLAPETTASKDGNGDDGIAWTKKSLLAGRPSMRLGRGDSVKPPFDSVDANKFAIVAFCRVGLAEFTGEFSLTVFIPLAARSNRYY